MTAEPLACPRSPSASACAVTLDGSMSWSTDPPGVEGKICWRTTLLPSNGELRNWPIVEVSVSVPSPLAVPSSCMYQVWVGVSLKMLPSGTMLPVPAGS